MQTVIYLLLLYVQILSTHENAYPDIAEGDYVEYSTETTEHNQATKEIKKNNIGRSAKLICIKENINDVLVRQIVYIESMGEVHPITEYIDIGRDEYVLFPTDWTLDALDWNWAYLSLWKHDIIFVNVYTGTYRDEALDLYCEVHVSSKIKITGVLKSYIRIIDRDENGIGHTLEITHRAVRGGSKWAASGGANLLGSAESPPEPDVKETKDDNPASP